MKIRINLTHGQGQIEGEVPYADLKAFSEDVCKSQGALLGSNVWIPLQHVLMIIMDDTAENPAPKRGAPKKSLN